MVLLLANKLTGVHKNSNDDEINHKCRKSHFGTKPLNECYRK